MTSEPFRLTCPCGATEIEVPDLPDAVVECNCGYCSKKGALWGYYAPSRVRILREAAPGVWKPNQNEHHFCATCGATAYTITPNWQKEWQGPGAEDQQMSINLRLLDGDALAGLPVEPVDGRTGWS